jgi:cytochrome c556
VDDVTEHETGSIRSASSYPAEASPSRADQHLDETEMENGAKLFVRAVALVTSLLAVALGAGFAQTDPIAARRELMKANGRYSKLGSDMIRGKVRFDLGKAKAVFDSFIEAGNKLPDLFPENSKTGGETTASPAIWTHWEDVKARFAKFAADAKAAQDATKDLGTFRAGFRTVSEDCDSCHERYRLKKG